MASKANSPIFSPIDFIRSDRNLLKNINQKPNIYGMFGCYQGRGHEGIHGTCLERK